MRTAVISDLHLGTRTRADILRRPAVRAALADALQDADELVLLGDVFELRDRPVGQVLDVARPVLETLGASLRGTRVVLVPGNHDHRLAWEALNLRRRGRRRRLGLAEQVRPGYRGPLAAMREALGCDLVVAYPGYWIAEGVWATHGHYLDVHSSAPTLECAATAVLGAPRPPRLAPRSSSGDYEAVLWPTYRLFYGIAQRPRLQALADAGKLAVATVEAALGTRGVRGLDGADERAPSAPFGLRLGGGRLGTTVGEHRRPGLRPFARALESLGVEADLVLFGHTHRTGPRPDDDPGVWRTARGTSLINTGSWVYEPSYVGDRGAASPYWPGSVTFVDGARRRPVIESVLSAQVVPLGK